MTDNSIFQHFQYFPLNQNQLGRFCQDRGVKHSFCLCLLNDSNQRWQDNLADSRHCFKNCSRHWVIDKVETSRRETISPVQLQTFSWVNILHENTHHFNALFGEKTLLNGKTINVPKTTFSQIFHFGGKQDFQKIVTHVFFTFSLSHWKYFTFVHLIETRNPHTTLSLKSLYVSLQQNIIQRMLWKEIYWVVHLK